MEKILSEDKSSNNLKHLNKVINFFFFFYKIKKFIYLIINYKLH